MHGAPRSLFTPQTPHYLLAYFTTCLLPTSLTAPHLTCSLTAHSLPHLTTFSPACLSTTSELQGVNTGGLDVGGRRALSGAPQGPTLLATAWVASMVAPFLATNKWTNITTMIQNRLRESLDGTNITWGYMIKGANIHMQAAVRTACFKGIACLVHVLHQAVKNALELGNVLLFASGIRTWSLSHPANTPALAMT